jgi:hypothetical protein
MATELRIPDSTETVKVRSPIAVALLPFVTFGIYHLVWWYRVNKEMKDYGESLGYDLGRSPTRSVLAVFPGVFLIVPPLISYWRGTVRVQGTQALADIEPVNGFLVFVLWLIISPAMFGYLQMCLNEVWEKELRGR